jgi:hypothetical protein
MSSETTAGKTVGIGIVGIGFMGMIRTGFQFLSAPSPQTLCSTTFAALALGFLTPMKHYPR